MTSPFDLVLTNGTVIDGSGGPRRPAAVAVRGGAIAAVGDVPPDAGKAVVDVRGLIVAPGFIDVHTHSDISLIVDPRAQSKIRQGVTTEVVGNCSYSPAPITDRNRAQMVEREYFRQRGAEYEWSWSTMGEYMEVLERQGTALNVATIVGHAPIRSAVMGYDKRYATPAELDAMKELLVQALDDGVWGLSTGLIYPPSSYADTEELVELMKAAAPRGGMYCSHIRGEGVSLLRAVAEAIEIGERSGAPVQISHLKAQGEAHWGRVNQALALIEAAQDRGQDVAFDVYPYTAGFTGLTALVPDWAQDGGTEAMLARIDDPKTRARMEADMASPHVGFDRVMVSAVPSKANAPLVGKTITAVADERRITAAAAALDLLREEAGDVSIILFAMDEADVRTVLRHRSAMIGSDGMAISPEPPLGTGSPHPRWYGTFPRMLGHYARDERLFSLEAAVHKMTGIAAERFGLRSKGVIEPGRDADMVVFDADRIRDTATYEAPHSFPAGIIHVLVNGEFAVRDSAQTEALAGEVLRRERTA